MTCRMTEIAQELVQAERDAKRERAAADLTFVIFTA